MGDDSVGNSSTLNDSSMAEDDLEEEMTAAEVLNKLEEAWKNEKFAPELLEAKSELVDCLIEQIKHMENNIEKARKRKFDWKLTIHRMEIDRIRFLISSYMRTRLAKIEQFSQYLITEENSKTQNEQSKLSPEEMTFLRAYVNNFENHLKSLVVRHMPQNLQEIDREIVAERPNLNSYLFFKVINTQQQVLVEPEPELQNFDTVDLNAGSQYLMRYRPVASLLQNGDIELL